MVQTIENHTVLSARRDNEILRKVLDWLWEVAIGPILEELKFTETRDEWPRVMWVPVGLLSLFPLHAAGSTIDRVISSYTPTLRALGHARDQIGRSNIKNILIATMATTPKRSPLPFVVEETNIINTLPLQRTILQNPSKTQVLEQLAQCSIAHFACHGQVDTNPSKSLLLFADWENDPFSVADMAAVNLDQAQIAVLSACHAANMRNLSLLDESIHMAGACQLAGFPTVIGSLWQVQDQYSPTVSEWLYRAIFKETADITQAAEGLHFAVRKVREDSQRRKFKGKGLDNPIAWAPYIHVGI
jgi:CHAT domain-containing protein